MPITTLGGIFEEPKKPYKRNFIKENVRSVRQMQHIIQGARMSSMFRSKTSNDLITNHSDTVRSNVNKPKSREKLRPFVNRKKTGSTISTKTTFSDNSVQTIDHDIENSGDRVIIPRLNFNSSSLEKSIENLKINDEQSNTDYKHTKNIVPNKQNSNFDDDEVFDVFCPLGHVLLPEIERKQTLKNLRERYSLRILELNSLSLRSDTLRIKKKRTEIEEDLKRLDAAIRTFERPRVYVKCCS